MELDELRRALEASGAAWTAGETSLSQYEFDPESMERLGYVPGPEEPSLDDQERRAQETLEAVMVEEPSYPPSHDWREVDGSDFISPIRDQSACGSCVAFGTCATVEGTLRVQEESPELEIDLSEAQLFYCIARSQGRRCSGRTTGGWWPAAALDAFRDEGVSDEECYPYRAGDQECSGLCADWQQRLTRIVQWHEILELPEMKRWLASRGPLVGTMKVYEDFARYYTGGVYRHVAGAFGGGHCVCIVGYDDNGECWIGKNSWGTRWGEQGFFQIAYGECAIDSTMWAVDQVVPATTGAES